MIGCIPPMVIVQTIAIKFMVMGTGSKGSKESGEASTIVNECCQHIRTVNSLGLSHKMVAGYRATLNNKLKGDVKNSIISGFSFGFSQFTQFGIQAAMFWFGARMLCVNGDIPDGWCIANFEDMMTA